MALTESGFARWEEMEAKGAKPDAIIAAIKADRAAAPVVKGEPAAPAAPVKTEGRGPVETFVRKASSAVSSNFVNPIAAKISSTISGQPYGDALKGINESDASAAQDNPIAATAGTVAGTGLQLAAPLGGVAKGAGMASKAVQAAKVGAGFGAAQGAGDALEAGGGAADALAGAGKGALGGAVVGGTAGAVTSRLFRGAPEREAARILSNVTRGEAGGVAKGKLGSNVVAAAGEGGERLIKVADETGLRGKLSVTAAAHPDKAAKSVQKVLDQNEATTLGPVYKAIDAAGTGPTSLAVRTDLAMKAQALRDAGHPELAEGLERYKDFIQRNYPEEGQVLSGSMIRKMKGSIGKGAFKDLAEENTSFGTDVKRAIYGVFSGAVERSAEATPGVDVAALKLGNERAHQLLGAMAALSDRANKAAQGRSTLANAVASGVHKASIGGAFAHALATGDAKVLTGALVAEGGYQIAKRLPQMVRHLDAAASKVERAARAKELGAQITRELGEHTAGRIAAKLSSDRIGSIGDE